MLAWGVATEAGMRKGRIGAATAAAFAVTFGLAAGGIAAAQQATSAGAAPGIKPDPSFNSEDQLAPSQIKQKIPARVAEPGGVAHAPTHPATHIAATAHPAAARAAPRGAHVVACSGVFSKESNQLRLALAYDYKNVTFADVDADGGNKVKASILFANDPRLRVEIWWSNPAERSGIYLIDIKGKSTWTAPGGMRLGLNLAQMEKLNNKPFKLKGFDKNGVATVTDWDGGTLATLPGGCKSGMSFAADPKASPNAVGAMTADKEFSSSDPAMRSVKPAVSEILIGY
jgi:hypothetical protein